MDLQEFMQNINGTSSAMAVLFVATLRWTLLAQFNTKGKNLRSLIQSSQNGHWQNNVLILIFRVFV